MDLAKKGCSITFEDHNNFNVPHEDNIALRGTINKGVMELDISLGKCHALKAMISTPTTTDGPTLHSRLGHPGIKPFLKIYPDATYSSHCESCVLSKHHWLPYSGTFKLAEERLDLLQHDLSGITSPPSIGGGRDYFEITDSCTSFKFIYILHNKSETFPSFVKFKADIENQKSKKIKAMVNDNGGEFISNSFAQFLADHGISMLKTAP